MQFESSNDEHPGEGPADDGWFDADLPPVPDALDRVVELSAVMSMHAAQLLERVEAMRAEWLEDALPHGQRLSGVAERSLRLELAAALGLTEAAAII